MSLTEHVRVGDKTVTVHELTVAEVRTWLLAEEQAPPQEEAAIDIVEDGLLPDVTFGDLRRMSDIPENVLEAATPSELAELAEVVKRVNHFFFDLRNRIVEVSQALREQDNGAATSSEPARSSSNGGT